MKKKIFFSILIFFCALSLAGFLKVKFVEAAGVLQWLWGGSEDSTLVGASNDVIDGNETGVGWISLSSGNTGAGGGVSYGVDVPTNDGGVTGYAWSGNLQSYIDFNPRDHCTTGVPGAGQYKAASCTTPSGGSGGVFRSSGKLIGWARIVGIARETANNNAGGYDGWINMNAETAKKYEVKVSPSGVLSGHAWSEFGDLSFNTKPVITLTADAPGGTYLLAPGETKAADVRPVLTWTFDQPMASCTPTCTDMSGNIISPCPGWTNSGKLTGANPLQGFENIVSIPATQLIYKLKCIGENGMESNEATQPISIGCSIGTCASEVCNAHTGTFFPTDDGNDPKCLAGCESNTDCVLRQSDNWREVDPTAF